MATDTVAAGEPEPDVVENTLTQLRTSRFKLSADAWAVALALGLTLLIWSGIIDHVPW